jgi:hypothetical protein
VEANKANGGKRMTKTLIVAGVASIALAVSPAFADKLTKAGGKNIEVGGKAYEVSGSRTKVTVGGKSATRDDLKVGMDCTVAGPAGGEATTITCK